MATYLFLYIFKQRIQQNSSVKFRIKSISAHPYPCYTEDCLYPWVLSICFPHMAQIPFLYAQPWQ